MWTQLLFVLLQKLGYEVLGHCHTFLAHVSHPEICCSTFCTDRITSEVRPQAADAMRCDVIHNSQVNFLFILLWNTKLWLEKILTTTFYGDSFCYSTRWFFLRFYLRFIQSTRDEVVLDQLSI